MSEILNSILERAKEKSIKNEDEIECAIKGFLNIPAFDIKIPGMKKTTAEVVSKECNLDPKASLNLSMGEMIVFLANTREFASFDTHLDDESIDYARYPNYLAFFLANELRNNRKNDLVNEFLSINFYKYVDLMLSSLPDMMSHRRRKVLKSRLYNLSLKIDLKLPDEESTIGEVLSELGIWGIKPWIPGAEEVTVYGDRIMEIHRIVRDVLVSYLYLGRISKKIKGVNLLINKYCIFEKIEDPEVFFEKVCKENE